MGRADQISLPLKVNLAFGGGPGAFPRLARLLLSLAVQPPARRPLCVVLPYVEDLAPLLAVMASLEFLSVAPVSTVEVELCERFREGSRVRVLPDGFVYTVGKREVVQGMGDGIWLEYTTAANARRASRFFVPLAKLARYELTTRRLPVSDSKQKIGQPPTSVIDHFAARPTLGNSSLIENKIVLIDSRAQFEEFLPNLALFLRGEDAADLNSFAREFIWGAVSVDGGSAVINPSGGAGEPMVALARDVDDASAFLNPVGRQVSSHLIITDRLTHVLNNLDSTSRLADRHQVVVLSPTSRREEIAKLKSVGWLVWEPAPIELTEQPSNAGLTGLVGLDSSIAAASAEAKGNLRLLACDDPSLSDAYAGMTELSRLLEDHVLDDPTTQQILDRVERLYFEAAGLMRGPTVEKLTEWNSIATKLANWDCRYLSGFAGAGVVTALNRFIVSIQTFLSSLAGREPTKKGLALLSEIRALDGRRDQACIITGHANDRNEIEEFLEANAEVLQCRLARDSVPVSHFVGVDV